MAKVEMGKVEVQYLYKYFPHIIKNISIQSPIRKLIFFLHIIYINHVTIM